MQLALNNFHRSRRRLKMAGHAIPVASLWLILALGCFEWGLAQLAQHAKLPRTGDSAIGMSIMGTIVKAGSGNGVALIKEAATGSVKAVKSGNPILNKTFVVNEVHAKYIIVQRPDQSLLLVFQDKFAREFSGGNVVADPVANANPASSAADVYREEGFERVHDQVKMSSSYRDRLVNQELAKILMQATAEPALENGALVGFKFTQVDQDSIYAKSGIRDDDVITGINGQKLNSVAEAVTLLKSLKQADQMDIEFKRSGTAKRLQINVN